MLFNLKANTAPVQTTDSGKIHPSGTCRLSLRADPATTRIRPAETGHRVASTRDAGKIRLGGACRLPLAGG